MWFLESSLAWVSPALVAACRLVLPSLEYQHLTIFKIIAKEWPLHPTAESITQAAEVGLQEFLFFGFFFWFSAA